MPEIDLEGVKKNNPIPVVIESRFHLKMERSGRGFKAIRCPFHQDDSPSFSVYMGKDGNWYFKCFGASCGKSGDVFDLVGFQIYGLGWNARNKDQFKEVLKTLDSSIQFEIPAEIRNMKPREVLTVTPLLQMALQGAAAVYGDYLHHSEDALSYLRDRHIGDKMMRKYRFGFCPADGTTLMDILPTLYKIQPGVLAMAGIFHEFSGEDGKKRFYESFKLNRWDRELGHETQFQRGRIVFADIGRGGAINYLFARVLPEDDLPKGIPRYLGLTGLNKPVFGLESLDEAPGEPIFMLEGQIDKITLEQWGLGALAMCGGMLSMEQEEAILKTKRRLILVTDNDLGGDAATSRLYESRLKPQILFEMSLPAQLSGIPIKDPNDLEVKLQPGEGERIFKDLVHARKAQSERTFKKGLA